TNKKGLEKEWQSMRLQRLIYVRLAREFAIETPPCEVLETSIDVPSMEDVEVARNWFKHLDEHIQVHQMRQYLQTTTGVNEETLIGLLEHFLHKPQHNDADRDKVDFLLVQFLTQTTPVKIEDAALDHAYVAGNLEPILGTVDAGEPDWLSPLDELIQKA